MASGLDGGGSVATSGSTSPARSSPSSGTSFTQFALPLLVFKLTGSPTNLALTTAATFVPYLLFGLVLGAVVDQVDRRRMMVSVDLARAAVIAVLPVLSLTGHLEVWHIYVVAFVQSTLGILFDCGEFAAVPSLVPADDLVTANGWIMATNNAGQVLGPVLAGVLLAVVPVADLLFVDSRARSCSRRLALLAIRQPASTTGDRADRRIDAPAVAGSGDLRRDVARRSALRPRPPGAADDLADDGAHQLRRRHARRPARAVRQGGARRRPTPRSACSTPPGRPASSSSASSPGRIRRRLSFAVTALGALVVSGLALAAFGLVDAGTRRHSCCGRRRAVSACCSTSTPARCARRSSPPHLFGRVISIAGVLAWSAIPLGAIAGARVIEATDDVAAVYVGMGLLTAAIAAAFAFSPVRDGDRYLAEAKHSSDTDPHHMG